MLKLSVDSGSVATITDTLLANRFVPDSHPSWRAARESWPPVFRPRFIVRVLPRERGTGRDITACTLKRRKDGCVGSCTTFFHLRQAIPLFSPANLQRPSATMRAIVAGCLLEGCHRTEWGCRSCGCAPVYLGSSPATSQHNSPTSCKSWKRP